MIMSIQVGTLADARSWENVSKVLLARGSESVTGRDGRKVREGGRTAYRGSFRSPPRPYRRTASQGS